MSFYCTADGKKRDLFVWHGAPALHTWRGDFGTSPHYYDLLPYDVFFFIPRVLRDRTKREGESSFYSQPQILADGFQSVIKRSFSSHHRERVQEGPIIHRPAYLFMRIIETLAHPVFSSSNLGLLLITIPAMFTAVSTTPFLYTRKALRTHCQTYRRTTFSFDVWMTGLSLSFFSQLFNQQNFHSLVPFFATMRSVECTGEISCAATKKIKRRKKIKGSPIGIWSARRWQPLNNCNGRLYMLLHMLVYLVFFLSSGALQPLGARAKPLVVLLLMMMMWLSSSNGSLMTADTR